VRSRSGLETPAIYPADPSRHSKEIFMNDIRRTILWVIFGFSIVLLWDQWQVYSGRQATFFPKAAPALTAAPVASKDVPLSGPSELPTASAKAPAAQVPDAMDPASEAPLTAPIPRESVIVSTDVLQLTFDSDGGSIVKSELLKHSEKNDP
jgi:YidC/Oxa1 family membrane protein insertase